MVNRETIAKAIMSGNHVTFILNHKASLPSVIVVLPNAMITCYWINDTLGALDTMGFFIDNDTAKGPCIERIKDVKTIGREIKQLYKSDCYRIEFEETWFVIIPREMFDEWDRKFFVANCWPVVKTYIAYDSIAAFFTSYDGNLMNALLNKITGEDRDYCYKGW